MPCTRMYDPQKLRDGALLQAQFFETVRSGFAAPRKQLHNSLAQGLDIPPQETATLLARVGIDQKRRAQTLSLEEWARVCREFKATALKEQ